MPEEGVRGLGLLEDIRRRRKEAREMNRLLHPEPLITEIRRRKRIKVKLLVLQRAGDFAEDIAKILRNPDIWEVSTAGIIVDRILTAVLPI